MPLTIHETLHERLESVLMLDTLVAKEAPRERMQLALAKYPDRAAWIEAAFAPSILLNETLGERVDVEREDVQLLFATMPEYDTPLWALYLLQLDGKPADKAENFTAYIQDADVEAHSIVDEASLQAYLRDAPLSYQTRGKLLLVWSEYEQLQTRLFALVEEAEAVLRMYAPLYEADLRQKMIAHRAEIDEIGFSAWLARHDIPVTLADGAEYALYPHIGLINSLRMIDNTLFLGAELFALTELSARESYTPEKVQEVLRVLGDRTKFDILRMLGEERLYGGELAARLGLTAATISHHISQLTTLSLVHIIKEGTRVYYQANKETLAGYLDAARQLLTS